MDHEPGGAGRDAELAELRGRLAAVEACLGGPWPWRGAAGPAPPTLPALARRVAALEQGAGGAARPASPHTPVPLAPPPSGRPPWRERAQGVLAGALLLALLAWLLHPGAGPGGPGALPRGSPSPAPPIAAPPRAVPAASAPRAYGVFPVARAPGEPAPAVNGPIPRAPLSRDQLLYDGTHPGLVEALPGEAPRGARTAVRCTPSGACLVP